MLHNAYLCHETLSIMPVKRYFYGASIGEFLRREQSYVIGELTRHAQHDINRETSNSWSEEVEVLQRVLRPYEGRGSVYLEYNIPRMGRRADAIVLIDGRVVVIEFKTAESLFTRDAAKQAWDYALDLKNFQAGSRRRSIVPIVMAPKEKNDNSHHDHETYDDGVYRPLLCNAARVEECIKGIVGNVPPATDAYDDRAWANSGYEPTPTIVEAAVALYKEHTVEDITRHDGNVDEAAQCIRRIIEECRRERRKAICFVTGVPGAGKTLIGLQTAIDQFNANENAVYLSGNFPLVEVLQEALTRDFVRRAKLEYKAGRTTEKPPTKAEAKSQVKAFIQMVHHYRDLYLEGTEVKDGRIVQRPGYFQSHTDRAYIPAEHVAIFDEAQRAWTHTMLADFMRKKKHIDNFPLSEPDYLLSCMDRQTDWGLVVCLVGGGQEINRGEAGISEWIKAINAHYRDWHVYMSDRLLEGGYAAKQAIDDIGAGISLHKEPSLHLSVSMRSFRAEKVSLFVHQLLELKADEARATLNEMPNYRIAVTRSLAKAKAWLRKKARGNERYGLLASSKAERLKAVSINVRFKPDFVHWFLDDDIDIRSSNALEDSLTEFEVQGLEIDWACVAWDADLRLSPCGTKWQHHELRGGSKWQRINKAENQAYQINAYRVLLTRARQGMIIFVPEGSHSIPPDQTRSPEWYDGIYRYLLSLGIPEV